LQDEEWVAMVRLTGGQILVEAIKREGIETIFGLPGIQLDNLFDALYASRESLRVIHTRHEQATSYMADGYARTTGKVGTCLVVPGPGLLNATAGLSTAYACSSPVLCLTGQIESGLIGVGRGELHEIPNQLQMLESVTKWAARADSPAAIPGLVAEAFRLLRSGRPRPVALEIPPDVLGAQVEIDFAAREAPERIAPEAGALRRAAEILRGAERPLIFAGGGVLGAGAWDEVRALAETLQAPVIMTENGRGILSDRHPLAHTSISARHLLPQADAILAVGTRLLEASVWIGLPAGVPVIQIDVDPEEVGRNTSPAVGIVGDAKLGLEGLIDLVGGGNARPLREAESLAIKEQIEDLLFELQPQQSYAAAIRTALPDDGIVVSEMTQMGYYSGVGLPIYEPRTYLTPGYQGTLGYGYATALGAQVGNPDKKVIAICGDGGFMYNVQELATAKQHRIPLVGIVFNDGAFGNVKRIQKSRLGGNTYGSELQNPDFVALAKAFGIAGMRAETPEALEGVLREALATDEPVLIDAPVGEVPSLWSVLYPSAPESTKTEE
jgi:acetolactate synthase-1/2/3 large subunit